MFCFMGCIFLVFSLNFELKVKYDHLKYPSVTHTQVVRLYVTICVYFSFYNYQSRLILTEIYFFEESTILCRKSRKSSLNQLCKSTKNLLKSKSQCILASILHLDTVDLICLVIFHFPVRIIYGFQKILTVLKKYAQRQI